MGGAKFSEWGALLFYQEVMATVEVFELADEKVHSHEQGQGQGPQSQHRVERDVRGGIRSKFYPLLWAVKLLTLDKPGDVSRYHIPAATFVSLEGKENRERESHLVEDDDEGGEESSHHHSRSSASKRRSSAASKHVPVIRSDADITGDLARQILARRVDFNQATISKLKLNVV